jgi:ketosteroid isomerase-like protein
MVRLQALLATALASFWLADAAHAESENVRAAVEAGNRAFVAAFLKGDSQAISRLYTEDGQVIAPAAPVATGRPALAAFWQGSIESGVKGVVLETAAVEAAGDLAVETGNVRLTARDGTLSEARYLVVWKRIGKQWLMHRDIWNSLK